MFTVNINLISSYTLQWGKLSLESSEYKISGDKHPLQKYFSRYRKYLTVQFALSNIIQPEHPES